MSPRASSGRGGSSGCDCGRRRRQRALVPWSLGRWRTRDPPASLQTNPEPRAPKTIPAIPAAAPQPPSPPSPHGKLSLAAGPPQSCWDLGKSPENIRTQASSREISPVPQPCSPRGAAAPRNPRPACSGAADQPAHQGKIPVFLFYSLCLLPRREPTGTNTL